MRISVRFIFAVIAASIFSVSVASASDSVFTNLSSAKGEAARLVSEARDLASKPLDIENGGVWQTLGIAGATGLAYLFDNDVRTRIQNIKSESADKAAKAGSFVGDPFLHLGFAALVYGGGVLADSPKHRDIGLMLGEAALLADATTFVLKEAIGRARPFVGGEKGSFRPFQFRNDYDSLPSAHTASSFAMASVVAATSESVPVKLLSYGTALFVGFSRMYQDKHWASDAVLGAAIGEICGRVVINTHVRQGSKVRLAPAVSSNAVSLAMVGYW